MQAETNQFRVVCFFLFQFFSYSITAQLRFTYQPKDTRVPIAKIILSDSSMVYGYAFAISDSTISLHQNFNDPENITLNDYHFSAINQIQYQRKGDFKAGFNRGFWPVEILFANVAIQNWDSGWGALILAAGTMTALPPGILLGIVENTYNFNKTYVINQNQTDFARQYKFAKSRIKPSWTGILQTHTGRNYLTSIIGEEKKYKVNHVPKWGVNVFTGVNFSNFNRAFQNAYQGSQILTEKKASIQNHIGFGLSYTFKQKFEIGYKYSDGLNYEYYYHSNLPNSRSTIEVNFGQKNNSFYVLKHFVIPDFNQKMIRFSAGAGLNLAEIYNYTYLSHWEFDSEIWQVENADQYYIQTSVQLSTRTDFVWSEKLSIFLQTDAFSPMKSSFNAKAINPPSTLSISDFDFQYYVFALNYGVNIHF